MNRIITLTPREVQYNFNGGTCEIHGNDGGTYFNLVMNFKEFDNACEFFWDKLADIIENHYSNEYYNE